jgi:hypothetical protein
MGLSDGKKKHTHAKRKKSKNRSNMEPNIHAIDLSLVKEEPSSSVTTKYEFLTEDSAFITVPLPFYSKQFDDLVSQGDVVVHTKRPNFEMQIQIIELLSVEAGELSSITDAALYALFWSSGMYVQVTPQAVARRSHYRVDEIMRALEFNVRATLSWFAMDRPAINEGQIDPITKEILFRGQCITQMEMSGLYMLTVANKAFDSIAAWASSHTSFFVCTESYILNVDALRNYGEYEVILDFSHNLSTIAISETLEKFGPTRRTAVFNVDRCGTQAFADILKYLPAHDTLIHCASNAIETCCLVQHLVQTKSARPVMWRDAIPMLPGIEVVISSVVEFKLYEKFVEMYRIYSTGKKQKAARTELKSYLLAWYDEEKGFPIDNALIKVMRARDASEPVRTGQHLGDSNAATMIRVDRSLEFILNAGNGNSAFHMVAETSYEVSIKAFSDVEEMRASVDHLFLYVIAPISVENLRWIASRFARKTISVCAGRAEYAQELNRIVEEAAYLK